MSNEGRRWFEQRKDFKVKPRDTSAEAETPDLFTRCPSCGEMLFNEALESAQQVCPVCAHHFRIDAPSRLIQLCDPNTLVWTDEDLAPVDALGFVDSKPYPQRITASKRKTGRNDAFYSATGDIEGLTVEVGCIDFRYMGGSMGSVVGEAITRLYERATENKRPAIVISASGGARMQEGVLSLMQMAKTCSALARLKDDAGMPYISVLTNPTTGGVAASFAMLGDVIVAEPGALIGFAGARVIKETIGQDLPEGFQTSEYLLEHGMVDMIVHRDKLRSTLSTLLRQLLKREPPKRADGEVNATRGERLKLADVKKPELEAPESEEGE